MPRRFNFKGDPEQPFYLGIVASSAQGGLDIDLRVRQEAGTYLAVRGQP
jgi:hypothetical protein